MNVSDFPLDLDERQLLDEWLAYPDLTSWHIRRLKEAGVSPKCWIAAGEMTSPRIRAIGRTFIPDPMGEAAYCLKVFDGEPAGPINPDSSIPLVDLLAFRLEAPDRWYLRRGKWNLVLGKDQFVDAMAEGRPCVLHPTPLDWLRAECRGACPLDLAEAFQATERYWREAA